MRYCSQCKNSEYVYSNGKKVLCCHRFQELGIPRIMKTSCVRAMSCESFVPERRADVPLKNKIAWQIECAKCGISTIGLSYDRMNN